LKASQAPPAGKDHQENQNERMKMSKRVQKLDPNDKELLQMAVLGLEIERTRLANAIEELQTEVATQATLKRRKMRTRPVHIKRMHKKATVKPQKAKAAKKAVKK
jgi:hypothetical protein